MVTYMYIPNQSSTNSRMILFTVSIPSPINNITGVLLRGQLNKKIVFTLIIVSVNYVIKFLKY